MKRKKQDDEASLQSGEGLSVDFILGYLSEHLGNTNDLLEHLDHLDDCLELCLVGRKTDPEMSSQSEENIRPIRSRIEQVRKRLPNEQGPLERAGLVSVIIQIYDIHREILEEFYLKFGLHRLDKSLAGTAPRKKGKAYDPSGPRKRIRERAQNLFDEGRNKHDWAAIIQAELERDDILLDLKTIRRSFKDIYSKAP